MTEGWCLCDGRETDKSLLGVGRVIGGVELTGRVDTLGVGGTAEGGLREGVSAIASSGVMNPGGRKSERKSRNTISCYVNVDASVLTNGDALLALAFVVATCRPLHEYSAPHRSVQPDVTASRFIMSGRTKRCGLPSF